MQSGILHISEIKPPLHNGSVKEILLCFNRWAAPTRSRAITTCRILNYHPKKSASWCLEPTQTALSPGASSHPLYQPKNTGKLRSHLADIEEQTNTLFLRLVKDYAASESVTERLKTEDPMEWVRRMNGIRARVMEIINSIIYSYRNAGGNFSSGIFFLSLITKPFQNYLLAFV